MKVVFLWLVLCFSMFSQAAVISLQTDRQHYQVGETVQLSVWLSDFSDTVGGYWTKLHWNTSAFALANSQFGAGFAGASLQYQQADLLQGWLTLEEYAFWDADTVQLAALQGQRFAVASISFVAGQAGDFSFALATDFLGAETFNGQALQLQPQAQQVHVATVSAPASWLLLISVFAWYRRRLRR